MTLKQQTHRRRRRAGRPRTRGVTLVEILVVLGIISLIAGATALALFKFLPEARIKTTRQSALTMRSAASMYRMDHTNEECPTIAMLTEAQLLDQATKNTDAWDTPFLLQCDEKGGIHVASAGPDKRMNTPDDILVPDAPPPSATQ